MKTRQTGKVKRDCKRITYHINEGGTFLAQADDKATSTSTPNKKSGNGGE